MQSIWFKKHNFSTIQKNSQYIKSWDMYELKLQYIKEFFVFNTLYLMDLWTSRFGVFLNDWFSGLRRIGEINLTLWPDIFNVSDSGSIISSDKLGRHDFLFRMLRVALVFLDWLSECLLLFFASLTLNWKRFDLFCTKGPCPLLFCLITAGVEWFFLIWEEVVFDALDFAPGILYALLCFMVDVRIFFTASFGSAFWFSTCFCVLAVVIFDFTCVYFLFVFNGVCVFFLEDKTLPLVIVQ